MTNNSSDDEMSPEKNMNSSIGEVECPVCLQIAVHPTKLPCGHVFCYLCLKGVVIISHRCALCRRETSKESIEHPQLVYGVNSVKNTKPLEDGYQWFYEGRNGWWQYDERTSNEIENAYKDNNKTCTIFVAGFIYIVDFDTMMQRRQNDPAKKRSVKRDLAVIPKKGIAGIRLEENLNRASTNVTTTNLTATTPTPPSPAPPMLIPPPPPPTTILSPSTSSTPNPFFQFFNGRNHSYIDLTTNRNNNSNNISSSNNQPSSSGINNIRQYGTTSNTVTTQTSAQNNDQISLQSSDYDDNLYSIVNNSILERTIENIENLMIQPSTINLVSDDSDSDHI